MSTFHNEGTIIILGGGWSVADQEVHVDCLKNHGFVIGVNDSGIHADVNCVISMDRLWIEYRWAQLQEKKMLTVLRHSSWRKNLKDKPRWPDLHFFENDHESSELSEYALYLNGFNSGFCALNLAYQMRPEKIYLFGFDHCKSENGKHYWHEPYPWSDDKGGATKPKTFEDWSKRFSSAASSFEKQKISVFNVSPKSALTNFPKISYQEFLQKCAN